MSERIRIRTLVGSDDEVAVLESGHRFIGEQELNLCTVHLPYVEFLDGRILREQGTKGQCTKYKGQLVSVDEETFSVDVEEKVAVEGKKRKETQIVTKTWRYEEPKYVKYDLKF